MTFYVLTDRHPYTKGKDVLWQVRKIFSDEDLAFSCYIDDLVKNSFFNPAIGFIWKVKEGESLNFHWKKKSVLFFSAEIVKDEWKRRLRIMKGFNNSTEKFEIYPKENSHPITLRKLNQINGLLNMTKQELLSEYKEKFLPKLCGFTFKNTLIARIYFHKNLNKKKKQNPKNESRKSLEEEKLIS